MYYAGKTLNINGKPREKGQPVPEAEGWSYPVRLAHLNLGWILTSPPTTKVKPGTAVEYPSGAAGALPCGDLAEASPPVPGPEKPEPAQAPKETNGVEMSFVCPVCSRKFKTAAALKTHMTMKHKGEA